jgi:hypothetical protein
LLVICDVSGSEVTVLQKGGSMRKILLSIIALLAFGALAQSQVKSTTTEQVYYDTFNEQWLNPDKWQPIGPFCGQGLTLECVREIQNGQLRLALRNMGDGGSDSDGQYSDDQLIFTNPSAIRSVTVDVTLRQVQLVACPTNTDLATRAIAKINGTFFNTGSGDPADDVGDSVFLYTDTTIPKTISVVNWFCSANGPCYGFEFARYPVGTPLTVTNSWDKANHQFVSTVKTKWEPGPGKRGVMPYSVSDTTPPVNIDRSLNVTVTTPNCTSARTFSHAEALFDNVMINATPESAE